MTDKDSRHISIFRYQAEYLDENHINLSSLVREKLDEVIPDDEIPDKDSKTADESDER